MPRVLSSRSSFLWLQLLLVAALACVVILLVEAFRAASSSGRVAERALRDYAGFAAWSYREHLAVELRDQVDELLAAVNHGDGLHTAPQYPDAMAMGHFMPWIEACRCHRPLRGPMPRRYVGFALGSDTVKFGVNLSAQPKAGWLADEPDPQTVPLATPRGAEPSEEERQWIGRTLTDVARRTPRSPWGYDVTVARRDSTVRVFAQRSMPTDRGDTIVYAVEYDADALDTLLVRVLNDRDLLPPSLVHDRDNAAAVDLAVADASGERVYATPRPVRWEQEAVSSLPASYGGLTIRMQMRPELAEALLIGGTPRSRVPLLLLVLTLAVVLTVLAGMQLRREARFAHDRANFVANVSHELRTPLTQVRLVLDTLRLGRGGDAAARDEALGIADREVRRLQHLVEGVLRYARGRRRDEARMAIDLLGEARTVVAEFAPLAEPRGVTLDVDGDEGVRVPMATGALRQTLLNLLDNAIKYGRDGGTVRVRVTRVRVAHGPAARAGDATARITVDDEGSGVPEAERARVFRPFERGRGATARAAGGSGIGLTIVADIAHEHGGRAWVESAPGGGARFVIELPVPA